MNSIMKDWVEAMPTAGDKVLDLLAYIGGTYGGGMLFPAVYGLLLWRGWDAPGLTSGWRWIAVGLGAALTIASIFYPAAFSRYLNRRRKEVADLYLSTWKVVEAIARKDQPTQADVDKVIDDLATLKRNLER